MNLKTTQSLLQLILIGIILVAANVISSFFYTDIDLTEDKRFTLNEATYRLIEELDDDVTVEIYLDGELPSSFRRLQNAVKDILDKFRSRTNRVQYQFINPMDGDQEENMAMVQQLKNDGIVPVNLTMSSKGSREARLVFPSIMIRYKEQKKVVNLLENSGGFNRDFTRMDAINPSINLLEYKIANAIQKLQLRQRPRMVILTGHGELERQFTYNLEVAMYEYYDIARLDLRKVTQIDTNIHVLIIPKPLYPMGDKHLFMIDQYIMNGGKVVWLVDALNMESDSMGSRGIFMPTQRPLDIHEILFNYGVRINPNLVLDWESSSIPVQVGMSGDKPQIELRKWYYHPKAYPYMTPLDAQEEGYNEIRHPIVQNIDFVDTRYPSSIDTIITQNYIRKTPLLRSSKYSKVQFPPVRVSIEIMDAGIGQDAFQKENQNIAVLLEGAFSSYYKNKISPEMLQGLQSMGQPFKEEGKPTKMIVISDGDIVRNDIERSSGNPLPLGMNRFDGYTYGNKDFIMNCLEYLIDNKGIIAARNKEIKLRPLDQERAFKEEGYWQAMNLVVPILILILFGVLYKTLRDRKFKN